MKVNIEIDCTPAEAREFMGLPDVEQANRIYIESVTKAMQGATNVEQMEEYARQLAPMGQMGMQMFQSFVEGVSKTAGAGSAKSKGSKS
ncbi:DUF6489 family protein [Aurantiacibacter sediminis]|uniref:Phasin domain-containing protein n=1 Tax=Aurantiacibacter sediminis TaxID=2793064 RepID=A0ABS0N0B4_9SPHN|nr:DUF6489 family protein [Aurantiacibacter sediminis]MBH5321406.1 hypothetical protein [Aurantiacibacter sediminis]